MIAHVNDNRMWDEMPIAIFVKQMLIELQRLDNNGVVLEVVR
jgi:hypothetical protein